MRVLACVCLHLSLFLAIFMLQLQLSSRAKRVSCTGFLLENLQPRLRCVLLPSPTERR